MEDMNKLRDRYVRGKESFRELAQEFGINPSTLRNRAAKEGWTAERNAYRTMARQIATEISAQEDGENMAKTIRASDMLDDVALALLEELSTNGLDILIGTRQPCRELESLSKALINTDELKRRLQGLLTPKDQAQVDLARDRLAFDKSKETAEHEDMQIRVVWDSGLDELGV